MAKNNQEAELDVVLEGMPGADPKTEEDNEVFEVDMNFETPDDEETQEEESDEDVEVEEESPEEEVDPKNLTKEGYDKSDGFIVDDDDCVEGDLLLITNLGN